MNRFLLLLKLKFLDIFAMRSLMVLLVLMPLLFGFFTGSASVSNRQPTVQLAVIDEENTPASAALLANLAQDNRMIFSVTEQEAAELLLRRTIDGVLLIKPGFTKSLADLSPGYLVYTPAPDSLVTAIAVEMICSAILPEHSRQVLLGQLETGYRQKGEPVPDDLTSRFEENLEHYLMNEARLDISFSDEPDHVTLALLLFDEYSLEVFFLSLFAVFGTISLTGQAVRQRLAATPRALLTDYGLTIITLQILGTGQVILYMASMKITMSEGLASRDLALLTVFIFLMQGLGQLFAFFPAGMRHFFSLMLLVSSAFAGGCFFHLPQRLLRFSSRFSPHGWVLSALRGNRAHPVALVLLFASLLLLAGYFWQQYQSRSTN